VKNERLGRPVVTEEEEVDPHSTFKMDGAWPRPLRSCATHLKYIQYVSQYHILVNPSYHPPSRMFSVHDQLLIHAAAS
jgi:hypothetical protein